MSNFKSAEHVVQGRFEITSSITPELYDTKSNYQLRMFVRKSSNIDNFIKLLLLIANELLASQMQK